MSGGNQDSFDLNSRQGLPSGVSPSLSLVLACFNLLPEHPHHFLSIIKPLSVFESETIHHVQRDELDQLLAQGWRTHAFTFFRYNVWEHRGRWHWIMPLRLHTLGYTPSKSQRKILRQNTDLTAHWRQPVFDAEHEDLFAMHAKRFAENAPNSLSDYLNPSNPNNPCVCRELEIRSAGRLVAASYAHIGLRSLSSVYAMFHPDELHRGLGILTMLLEIERARRDDLRWWYPGYTTLHDGIYDYKKNFHGLQAYDWNDTWHPFPKGGYHLQPSPLIRDWKNFP